MSQENLDAWFVSLRAKQRPVLEGLHTLITEAISDTVEELKWSRPCYSNSSGLFCYLHSTKNHAAIGFPRGASLDAPTGILEGDSKDMF